MSPRLLAAANGLLLVAALGVGGTLTAGGSGDPAVLQQAAAGAAPTASPTPAALPPSRPPVATLPDDAGPDGTPPPAAPAPAPASPAAQQPQAPPRSTTTTGYAPYARVGDLALHAPGDVVEVIGYHQSGHDGALPQAALPGQVRQGSLADRGRGTHPAGAADIVVDPAREVRSPVTGTVVRGGTYTLYCDEVDQYLVVEPDGHPGWEVKVLHVQGLSVAVGDRVQAGVTVVAAGARVLPFTSQVDAFTGEPSWPHVHVEVVDTAVPDVPGTGGGGGC